MTSKKDCKCRFSREELLENIPQVEKLEENAEFLKSISDPIRLKILYLLKKEELCVCEILEAINKSQATTSYHLKLLKKAKLITERKDGTWKYFKLKDESINEKIEKFIEENT